MPELPEVETVRRQLGPKLEGQTVESIEVYSEKQTDSDHEYEASLIGKKFSNIKRIGKLLIFSFYNESNLFLLGHLKMTGQLLFMHRGQVITAGGHTMSESDLELPNRHTRIQFNLKSGDTLFFNDLRKFGYLKIANLEEVKSVKSKYGPEPIDPDFDCGYFYQTISKSSQPIKALLLDQSKFAGLGNIYVDEALFRAKVLPMRSANEITKAESLLLCKDTGDVMRESIAVGGTTFRNFTDTNGEEGNFKDYLRVFGKQGQPCPNCGTMINKIKLRGRGTHFCPGCQK